ncbi:MAG TPA: class I SAM-dependent methyltransferase [Verrucomicrobiae bacterium]|jgi:ubiquinone/menaquinone biosynthesis C-methylase UbiE|nr:class I SAM-dependent methyltransferase [Verrucomicrobiae bacterium]
MQPPGENQPQPHSAELFGEQRDFWWNRDFLDLMAARWRLQEASSLADIGCGLGHWSRLLYPYLCQPARLTGVDREPRWVVEAPQHFRHAFPKVVQELISFHQGDATKLPLADNSFDVVTCQTLLMHLPQPVEAVREMLRILRPGGLLICVEPNNLWNYMAFTSLTEDEPVEVLVRRFEFWLRQHRGRIAAGRGNHSLGDLLPGLFAELGLHDVTVHQADRPGFLFPPYDAPAQKALIEQEQQWKHSTTGPWDRDDLRQLVLRGGGSEAFFETAFAEIVKKFRREQDAISTRMFHAAGGAINYLVSARKP